MGRTITVTLRDASFSTLTRSVTISYTNSTEDIYNSAKRLLHSNWDGKTPLRLLGVSLSQLVKEFEQISLFNNDERKRKLNKVMDEIKDKFGDGAIFRAKLLKDEELNERKLGRTENNAPALRGIKPRKEKHPGIEH
jgi:DNA polymerase-4